MATPRDALSDAQARWNAGDLDGYLELYDERTVLHELRARSPWATTSRCPGSRSCTSQGGRVVDRFSQADMLGLMVQMGAIPAPA